MLQLGPHRDPGPFPVRGIELLHRVLALRTRRRSRLGGDLVGQRSCRTVPIDLCTVRFHMPSHEQLPKFETIRKVLEAGLVHNFGGFSFNRFSMKI